MAPPERWAPAASVRLRACSQLDELEAVSNGPAAAGPRQPTPEWVAHGATRPTSVLIVRRRGLSGECIQESPQRQPKPIERFGYKPVNRATSASTIFEISSIAPIAVTSRRNSAGKTALSSALYVAMAGIAGR